MQQKRNLFRCLLRYHGNFRWASHNAVSPLKGRNPGPTCGPDTTTNTISTLRPARLADWMNTTYDLKSLVWMIKKEMTLLTARFRHVSSPTSPVQPLEPCGNHRLSNTSIPLPLQLVSPSLALYHTRIQTHVATHVNQERMLSRAARGIHVTLSLSRARSSNLAQIDFGHRMRLLSLFLKSCFSFSHCIRVT